MKKKNFFFISGIVIMFILLIVLDNMVPKPLDWTPTFNDNDKRPYGKYLVSRLAQKLFEGDWEFLDSSFYQVYSESEYFFSDSLYGNYVSITDSWDEDEVSFKKLMEWVALGNNAFISAHYFPKEFMDSLKIRTDIKYMFNFQKIKGKDSGKELNFTNPMLKSKQDYKYFRALEYSVVTRFDTASTTVLGRYKDGDPNFISIKFGDGMFYINTASYMFTNYNMVIGKNYEYAEKALSYLDRNYFTAWDKSNSMQMEQPTTPFRFILLNTPQ